MDRGMRVLSEILVKRGFVLCTMQEKEGRNERGEKETTFETNRMLQWPTHEREAKDLYNIHVRCFTEVKSKTD